MQFAGQKDADDNAVNGEYAGDDNGLCMGRMEQSKSDNVTEHSIKVHCHRAYHKGKDSGRRSESVDPGFRRSNGTTKTGEKNGERSSEPTKEGRFDGHCL